MNKVSINAVQLLDIEERLRKINQELIGIINAPERAKRITKQEKLIAKYQRK